MFHSPTRIPSSHEKNANPDSHMIDMSMETSQLEVRAPGMDSGFKRFKEDPWSTDFLCTNPNSPLAHIDLESIINYSNFQLFSSETQNELARLLPDSDGTVPPSFFSRETNSVFWNALDDWQLMLATGELSEPRQSDDSFKDEAYESYWGEISDRDKAHNVAGDSKNISLKDMCRNGLIRERDVILYKRNFSASKVVVSKSMTVTRASGTTGISIDLDGEIFQDFETPTALETKILDHHGEITKDKRPNGNAFKSIRLFRDGRDMGRLFDIRKEGFGSV